VQEKPAANVGGGGGTMRGKNSDCRGGKNGDCCGSDNGGAGDGGNLK